MLYIINLDHNHYVVSAALEGPTVSVFRGKKVCNFVPDYMVS